MPWLAEIVLRPNVQTEIGREAVKWLQIIWRFEYCSRMLGRAPERQKWLKSRSNAESDKFPR